MNLQGSWVAMPTPFTEDNQVDIEGFKLLIARQIKYGTNQLFILGSAGEVTLLSIEEKKLIVKSVIAYMKDRAARGLKVVPVFFSAASFTTEASVEFAQFCEAEGADGVVFTVLRPDYPARRKDPSGHLHEQCQHPLRHLQQPQPSGRAGAAGDDQVPV